MKKIRLPNCFFLIMILSFLLVFGCSGLKSTQPRISDTEAAALAEHIKNINKEIKTCKGSGWITILSGNKKQRYRVAFALSLPDRIRMTLLSAGIPIETIIADGKAVTFLSHTGEHSPYRIDSKNPSLKKFVLIPLKIKDIIALFAGQIPLHDFDSASILKNNNSKETILLLKKRWQGDTQKIYLNSNNNVYKFEVLDIRGEHLYSISLSDFKQYNSLQIPLKSIIINNSGKSLNFEITDYHPDITVKESVFTLTEPG